MHSFRSYTHFATTPTARLATTMNGHTEELQALTAHSMNPHVKAMEYAVRGPIVAKAKAVKNAVAEVSDCRHITLH